MQVLCGLQGIFLLFNCQTPDQVVPEGKAKQRRHKEIKDLFNIRMISHKDYFQSNNKITGAYNFVKKVVDSLS